MSDWPSFSEILRKPTNAVGVVNTAPPSRSGLALAHHRAPAHEFRRGASSDLLIVAQQNIAATSVEFDLGYGWREHFSVAPKPVYVVPADADARWRLDAASQCVFLSFPDTDAQMLLRDFGIKLPGSCLWALGSSGFAEELVHELVIRLWHEASAGSNANELLASSCRVAIMHALARRHVSLATRHSEARLTRKQLQRVLACIHFLGEGPVSVDELATSVGLSSWHFIRLFKNTTGKTPYRYYEEVRVEKAKALLSSGAASIAEIAARLSFAGPSQFSRAFRQATGLTPTAYRRHAQL
ncbi:MAG: hypothetical protein JWQ03_2204 [Variovorax sp.]|nr:hypothetical protein [Variovorax sp.]